MYDVLLVLGCLLYMNLSTATRASSDRQLRLVLELWVDFYHDITYLDYYYF